jgi:hypothetical protein
VGFRFAKLRFDEEHASHEKPQRKKKRDLEDTEKMLVVPPCPPGPLWFNFKDLLLLSS